jgi:glycine betaine/choline ABC-type transport system substrate-binding protein
MRRRQRFLRIAAALLTLTLLLSACSSAGSKRIDVITLGSYTWNEPVLHSAMAEGDILADFQKWYGFSFKKAVPMDVGLMYRAVAEHQADVAMAYSTDGRIKQLDLVALTDDKHFFPRYDAVPRGPHGHRSELPGAEGAAEAVVRSRTRPEPCMMLGSGLCQ